MPVVATGILSAAVEDVWAIVSDYGGLMRWHPQLARVDANGGSVVGATRTAYFHDGRSATERLEKIDHQKYFLEYAVIDPTGRPVGMTGSIELTKLSDDKTSVQWTSSGFKSDEPDAAERNERLRGYYSMRINTHLKNALGLADS